jgi:hypothetical protein
MTDKPYWKNFIFNQSPDNPAHPFGSFDFTQMFDMNAKNMAGCNNVIFCAWFREPLPEWQTYKPHVHDDEEIIGYFGSNKDDPFDLGGEVEIWIEDQPYNFTKSGMLFLPRGLRHCPWFIRKAKTPIFIIFIHSTSNVGNDYFVDDPKWKHLPYMPKINPESPQAAQGPAHTPPPLVSLEEHYRRQGKK